MNKKLKISKEISLPLEIVTQVIAILARRRAGKSYLMRRFVEQLFIAGQQVIIVDPKGDQWGIRSSADGKKPGLPIVILGGEHGDAPLEVNAGEVVAKLIVEERVSILLDLSPFRKHEVATFMTALLENIYRLKAREIYRTPCMMVIDEADAIAPQKPQKGEERMLGAIEDIVRRGGQRGIGCILVTQRSAVLNKNVLTQAQMLVVLRTIAPQDLAAMKAWIDVHGSPEQGKTLMESLPSLPVGDAWFWSPGWPTDEGIFKRTHVLPIITFDSGATPKSGEKKVAPKNLADVNLNVLKKQMAATIEKVKNDNPRVLRKRIAELERGNITHKCPVVNQDPEAIERAVKQALVKQEIELKAVERKKQVYITKLTNALKSIGVNIAKVLDEPVPESKIKNVIPAHLPHVTTVSVPAAHTIAVRIPTPQVTVLTKEYDDGENDGPLPRGEKTVLIEIAKYTGGLTRKQITLMTGYKTSTRNTYVQRLDSRGFIVVSGNKVIATQIGIEELGSEYVSAPDDPAEKRAHWLSILPQGEREIFRILVESYPSSMTREIISEMTGYKTSTRNTYIQRLSARELIVIQGPDITVPEELF